VFRESNTVFIAPQDAAFSSTGCGTLTRID